MSYDQNDCQQFSFITPLFPTFANTLKTKVGDVVGCIFEVECSVGGFLILKQIIRGDQEGLFKLVTLNRILNRITRVTSGCWWLAVVNAIPISDNCQINQQNMSSCSVKYNRIKKNS
jgi:hypothetical protein